MSGIAFHICRRGDSVLSGRFLTLLGFMVLLFNGCCLSLWQVCAHDDIELRTTVVLSFSEPETGQEHCENCNYSDNIVYPCQLVTSTREGERRAAYSLLRHRLGSLAGSNKTINQVRELLELMEGIRILTMDVTRTKMTAV